MRYLLDTHIVLWYRHKKDALSPKILDLLLDPVNLVVYSVLCPWELAIKKSRGRIDLPDAFFATLPTLGFGILPIADSHVDALRSLPQIHQDPFDRMLIAQAIEESMTLITSDKRLCAYPVKTLLV